LELDDAIETRRAYRAYGPVEITDGMVEELLRSASMAPSCNNSQPWKFIMVRDPDQLGRVFDTLTRGNYWMQKASLIVAVFMESGIDCEVQGVNYEMFDTGMATAFMMLKAVEMDLISHPIAGFDKAEVKKILGIGEQYTMITLIGIGKKNDDLGFLGEKHQEQEISPRNRKPLSEIGFKDRFG